MTARPNVYTAALDRARAHTDTWLASMPDRPVPPRYGIDDILTEMHEQNLDRWTAATA